MKKNGTKEIKKIKVDDLATMVQGGFDRQDKRFDAIDMRLGCLEYDAKETHKRLGEMERDLKSIKHHLVYREEFEDMMARMKYVERKLHIVSGK